MKSVFIFLSLGEFPKVLKLLHESQHTDLAALFARAYGFSTEKGLSKTLDMKEKDSDIPLEQLLQSIYLDYGFFLQNLGNIKGVIARMV